MLADTLVRLDRVDPVALVHPLDLAAISSKPGDLLIIESRRGKVTLYGRADESSPRGAIFVPSYYYEAAINRVTNDKLDPVAKIPELKYCAIRVTAGWSAPEQVTFLGMGSCCGSWSRTR